MFIKYIPFNQDISNPKYYEMKLCNKIEYTQPFDMDWKVIMTGYTENFLNSIKNKPNEQQLSNQR